MHVRQFICTQKLAEALVLLLSHLFKSKIIKRTEIGLSVQNFNYYSAVGHNLL